MLIEILILFFVFLLTYQSYLFIINNTNTNSPFKKNNIVEGYTDYEDTAYMLSQKNALNIQDLKERIDKISNINNNYDDLNNRLKIVEDKINNIATTSLANTKGKDIDTSQLIDLNDDEENNKKNGLPTTVNTTIMSSQPQGKIPPMDNLDINNNNNNLF